MLKLITTNYKCLKKIRTIISHVKYLKLSSKVDNNKYSIIYFKNNLNIFSLWSLDLINLKFLKKNTLLSNSNLIRPKLFFKKGIANTTKLITLYNLLEVSSYYLQLKFKVDGRVFRIKKKTNKIITCLLNYSHKIYLFKNILLSFFKIKIKKGRIILFLLLNFLLKKSLYLFNKKLRRRNMYTRRGITDKNSLISVKKKTSSIKK